MKAKKTKLTTIKTTDEAAQNFRVAAALSGKTQYEISLEASKMIRIKYTARIKG